MAGEEVASAWQMVRSDMGYNQDLGLVHQAAQAGTRSERPPLPRRIPKRSAKPGQKVRQRAGAREVDPRPSPSSKLSWQTSSWRPTAHAQRPSTGMGGFVIEVGGC